MVYQGFQHKINSVTQLSFGNNQEQTFSNSLSQVQTHSDPSSHVYFVHSIKLPYNFSSCQIATCDMINYEVTCFPLYSLFISKKFPTFCLHVDHQRTIQSDSKVFLIATEFRAHDGICVYSHVLYLISLSTELHLPFITQTASWGSNEFLALIFSFNYCCQFHSINKQFSFLTFQLKSTHIIHYNLTPVRGGKVKLGETFISITPAKYQRTFFVLKLLSQYLAPTTVIVLQVFQFFQYSSTFHLLCTHLCLLYTIQKHWLSTGIIFHLLHLMLSAMVLILTVLMATELERPWKWSIILEIFHRFTDSVTGSMT